MEITEFELEKYLMDTKCEFFYGIEKVKWRIKNQFEIPPYGIIDIIAIRNIDNIRMINIWELKKNELRRNDVKQLYRYVNGIINNSPNINIEIQPHLLYYSATAEPFYPDDIKPITTNYTIINEQIKVCPLLLHPFELTIKNGVTFLEDMIWNFVESTDISNKENNTFLFGKQNG